MAERRPSALEEAKAKARHAQELRTGATVARLSAPRIRGIYSHPSHPLTNSASRRAMGAIRSGWDAARALSMTARAKPFGPIPGLVGHRPISSMMGFLRTGKRGMASLAGVARASAGRGFSANGRKALAAPRESIVARLSREFAHANNTRKSPRRVKSANNAKARRKSKSKSRNKTNKKTNAKPRAKSA